MRSSSTPDPPATSSRSSGPARCWRAARSRCATGSGRGGAILGWEIRRSTRDFVLLGADSRIGMPAELLFKREGDGLLFATFVQHGNPAARTVWAGIEPIHGPTVRRLLADAARRWRERPAA